ncbi:MAG: hypothetical protein ACLT98_14975 [Eggerthellaceae bacterium]
MSQDFNFVLAGFGGQGLLFGGKVIATAGLIEDKELSCCLPTALKCAAAQQTAASASPTTPSDRRWSWSLMASSP